jgi:hypothetical protein
MKKRFEELFQSMERETGVGNPLGLRENTKQIQVQ